LKRKRKILKLSIEIEEEIFVKKKNEIGGDGIGV
jgi:hypothetical protein